MAISEQRLSLFALLSEFEADARDVILAHICDDHPIEADLGRETYAALQARASKKLGPAAIDDRVVLSFSDVGDAIRILLANRSLLPVPLAAAITRTSAELQKLPGIRNRVMHRRPLEFDDLPLVTDTMRSLIRTGVTEFGRVKDVLRDLSDGGRAGSFEKAFAYENEPSILNNLPQPDYEDTGFLGRREQVDELKKAIRGPFPVVTVLGVGGAGKSALALQVAYDILNSEGCGFDAIIWTSAKTSRLTGADVQVIAGAISSSIGIAEHALDQFGVSADGDPFESVRELLATFKVLLFIDNLETILDERVREFVRDVPTGSKIVFTSRIGLGAYDFVVPVHNLSAKEADTFFRRVAHVWKQASLQQTSKDELGQYLTRLNHSPLGIKWFIQAVAAGASAQKLLSDPTMLLMFCLENIVDKLSGDAKHLLYALAITAREHSPASLHYLTEIDPWSVEDALRELIGSHLITVVVSKFGDDDRYRIAAVAQTYLTRLHPPSPAAQANIQGKQQQLNAMAERAEVDQKRGFVYDPSYITIRPEFSGTDAVAANFLRRAIIAARRGDRDQAHKEIGSARSIASSFFEVMRVEGFLAANEGNIMLAQSAYEQAEALRPDHTPLLLLYSGFLLRHLQNGPKAEQIMRHALTIDSEAPELRMEFARTLLYQHGFDEAWRVLRDTDTGKLKNARAWRIFCDLLIQTCSRSAEDALSNGTANDFQTSVDRLRIVVTEMPSYTLDEQSVGHLRFSIGLARKFVKREGPTPLALQVDKALDVICSAIGEDTSSAAEVMHQLRGWVDMLSTDRPFGFIETSNGERMFFHKGNMMIASEFDRLHIGMPVTFSIGANAQGPCADEVRLGE